MRRKRFLVYTGYFGQLKKYPNPVSIANTDPSWYEGPRLDCLAPGNWFWDWRKEVAKGFNNQEHHNQMKKEYIKLYTEELRSKFRTSRDLILFLEEAADKKFSNHITLCCYEKAPLYSFNSLTINKDFCHRHIIAQFLHGGGYYCEEYKEF